MAQARMFRRLFPALPWEASHVQERAPTSRFFSITSLCLAEAEEDKIAKSDRIRKARIEGLRKYDLEHPGKRAESMRQYYRENPAAASERVRQWQQENPGKLGELKRQYYQDNPHAKIAQSERMRRLDQVNPEKAASRIECLRKWEVENPILAQERGQKMRRTKRESAIRKFTGKQPIRFSRKPDSQCQIRVAHYTINIGREMADVLGLLHLPDEQRYIKMSMDVANIRHAHMWAQKAIETDNACRLGIKLSRGAHRPLWMKSESPSAVAFANSVVAILTGEVTDPDNHIWRTSEYPIFGPWTQCLVSATSWNDTFSDSVKRRAASARGEVEKHTWKPTASCLKRIAKHQVIDKPTQFRLDPASRPPPR